MDRRRFLLTSLAGGLAVLPPAASGCICDWIVCEATQRIAARWTRATERNVAGGKAIGMPRDSFKSWIRCRIPAAFAVLRWSAYPVAEL